MKHYRAINTTIYTILVLVFALTLLPTFGSAEQPSEITLNIDPTEITLVENSIGCGYYVPWYSHIHYTNTGTAAITLPNKTVINIIPTVSPEPNSPENRVSKIIEVPSNSSVEYAPTSITVTFNDSIILTADWDTGFGSITNPNHPTPVDYNNAPSSWVEWATISPPEPTKYKSFTTQWVVPEKPTSTKIYERVKRGSVFYIFNGFEGKGGVTLPAGFDGGIVQPILIWNCGNIKKTCTGYPKTELWSGAAWADNKEVSLHGELIPAKPRDSVEGKVEWIDRTKSWTITFTDLTTGKTSTLTSIKLIPNDSNYIEPILCLEKYIADLICKDGSRKEEWPQSGIVFNNLVLKNDNNNDITSRSRIAGDYNRDQFEKITGCGSADPIVYDRNNYFVNTDNWPTRVTFQTPASLISTKQEL